MTQNSIKISLLGAGVALAFCGGASAEQITVGQGAIVTIQDAVDQALANADTSDTVLIPKGTYNESVTVASAVLPGQAKLTIKRSGDGQARIVGQGGPAVLIQGSENVVLQNLTLNSGSAIDGAAALRIDGQSANIEVASVQGVAGDDIGVVVSGVTVLGVCFTECDFSDMAGYGFFLDGFGHELTNCEASACGLSGIVLTSQALNCMLSGCTAIATGGQWASHPGVITLRGNGHYVKRTVAGGGGLDGFFVEGAGHRLLSCESNGNTNAGFNLDNTTVDAQVLLQNCTAKQNTYGLLGGGLGATVKGGVFNSNLNDGLRLTEGGTNLLSLTANSNGGHGIYVTAGVIGTKIRDCQMKNNGGEGVQVLGQLTWLERNEAKNGDGLIDGAVPTDNNRGRDNTVSGGGVNDF
ncbi:MAG: right-handed parallel beta-helix repeat-containing protein [Planctomycetes bacterium]|nr:right-handed parallel beta-helix repeat-containing protein [Planctomycetota bacterium]